MWLQLAFIILPFVSAVCFLLSLYGHKVENKKLNQKIKLLENKKVYNQYSFTNKHPY